MTAVTSPIVSSTLPVVPAIADAKGKGKGKRAPITKAQSPSLANANGEAQAKAIIAAIGGDYLKVASAALVESEGNPTIAATLVTAKVLPTLHLIARIIPILRSPAPSALFDDKNNRGARVGELFASKLGLSAIYRSTSKASLKDSRAHLIEAAK